MVRAAPRVLRQKRAALALKRCVDRQMALAEEERVFWKKALRAVLDAVGPRDGAR